MAGCQRHPLIESVVQIQESQALTGSEVARRLQINPSTWTRLTAGDLQPSLRVVQGIAREFPTLQLQCVNVLLDGNQEAAIEQDTAEPAEVA